VIEMNVCLNVFSLCLCKQPEADDREMNHPVSVDSSGSSSGSSSKRDREEGGDKRDSGLLGHPAKKERKVSFFLSLSPSLPIKELGEWQGTQPRTQDV
jgi:hypothetical protein